MFFKWQIGGGGGGGRKKKPHTRRIDRTFFLRSVLFIRYRSKYARGGRWFLDPARVSKTIIRKQKKKNPR